MSRIERFEDLRCWQAARALANEAYGLTASTAVEFIRCLRISRRSASEVQSQLYLALDLGYIRRDDLEQVYDLADDVKKCINGLIRYLNRNRH